MIHCPNCNKQLDDQATSCVNCGVSIYDHEGKPAPIWLRIVSAIAILIAAVFASLFLPLLITIPVLIILALALIGVTTRIPKFLKFWFLSLSIFDTIYAIIVLLSGAVIVPTVIIMLIKSF